MSATNKPSPRRASPARLLDRILTVATIVVVLLLIAVIVLWRIPGNYRIEVPATAESVSTQITIAGHPPRAGHGDLLMTFVAEPDFNMLDDVLYHFDPDATITPLESGYSAKTEEQQSVQQMLSSEQTAELVALCYVGHQDLCRAGVQIQTIETGSKASGILQANDVIMSANGKPTPTYASLHAFVGALRPGDIVTLQITRGTQSLTVRVPTILSTTTPHQTILGIALYTNPAIPFPKTLPVDITINPGNIGGPSAGLMFTLGILDRLLPGDLTHGQRIAGTGVINIDGTVSAIGGVKQKVLGAQWAGAKYFFVPCDGGNYQDARKAVGHNMTLVPVNTLGDALTFLGAIGAGGKPAPSYKFATCPATTP